jgi:hypothetical protein
MDYDNPLWGAEKIRGELLKLGIRRAKLTIQRILEPGKRPTPPKVTQNWRTFLKNHAPYIWATDYFTVTTATFKQLYVMVGQTHLRKILTEFIDYYNRFRPHQGIGQQIPIQFGSRPDPLLPSQPIRCKPILNGLHHHYFREAA